MRPAVLIMAGSIAAAARLPAQELRSKIESGPDQTVAISYPARADVCGSGGAIRVGGGGFGDGSWIWTRGDGPWGGSCDSGPVTAIVTRVQGRVGAIRLAIGPVRGVGPAADLGRVSGASAAGYFLELATRADGRIGRDAIVAAAVADSGDPSRGLARIAQDPTLSRALRESAAGWLGREVALAGPTARRELETELGAIARDPDAPISVRSRAVSALGRGEPVSVAALRPLATSDEPAVAKAALAALGRAVDPGARQLLLGTARDSAAAPAVRLEAIRALGGRDAAPADLAALRALWPTLRPQELQEATLDLLAESGGPETSRWLMDLAGRPEWPSPIRARAVRAAEQSGAHPAGLIQLYDAAADRRVREAILDALLRIGDRAARAKLAKVAESDTDPELRKAAVARLARIGDRTAVADLLR